MGRWSLQDDTGKGRGYLRLLCEGMSVCVDVFPFSKGADPARVKAKAQAIVDTLNAAEAWRRVSHDVGTPAQQFLLTDEGEMLSRAVAGLLAQ